MSRNYSPVHIPERYGVSINRLAWKLILALEQRAVVNFEWAHVEVSRQGCGKFNI